MTYKTFGRLAGKTQAGATLANTSEPNSTTPYDPAAPASKLIAYGEDALSVALNRAFAALSANSDYLFSLMGSPACRADILTPHRTNVDDYGFTALAGIGIGATQVDLGVGALRPIQWVYLGLHKDKLSDFIKMYRRKPTSTADDDYGLAGENDEVSPNDAKINSAGGTPSYFPVQTYLASPEHANADLIPPIARLAPDLPPYNQAIQSCAIASWDTDGVYITAFSSEELYLRPGCFIEVYGETSPTSNNGLWRIEAIRRADRTDPAGDKLVLGRGGVHKVSVDSVVGFTAGERVWWRSRPLDQAGSTADQRNHSAHVVFIDTNAGLTDLYLADFSSGEDFPVQGTGTAYKVNDDAASYTGLKAHNHVGMIDREASSNQNWSLTVGTLLYNESGANTADVQDVTGAGYPVRFDTTSSTGNFYPCNPVGWALNPTLQFAADAILGGDYYAHCFTLTTVREQMVSQGAAGNKGVLESPFTSMQMSRGTVQALRTYLKASKVGGQAIGTDNINGPFSASKMVLGEQRWKVTVVNETGGTTVDTQVTAGDVLTISMSAGNTNTNTDTTAVVVEVDSSNKIVLKEVTRVGWATDEDFFTLPPIEAGGVGAGSYFTAALAPNDTFRVSVIDIAPALADEAPTSFYPDFGLHAAYHAQYSAIAKERGSARGNWIGMMANKPLMLLQPNVAGLESFEVRSDHADVELVGLKTRTATTRARIKEINSSLTFYDQNTSADINFSGAAPNNALPAGSSSILESLRKGVLGSTTVTGPWSTAILGGAAISEAGLQVSATTAGLYVKQGQAFTSSVANNFDILPNDGTRYVAYNVASNTYTLDAVIDPSNTDKVYLHKYVTAGAAVTEDVNIRIPVQRVDQKTHLYVGRPENAAYSNEVGHFASLSAAFGAISVWENETSDYNTRWHISIIGGVSENENTLPLRVPCSGLTIEGAADQNYEIIWTSTGGAHNGRFFDLNNRSNLVFKNLRIKYQDTNAASDGVVSRVIWGETEFQHTGTAGGGTGSTITLGAGASAVDDTYNGMEVRLTNNSPAGVQGQRAYIIDYDGGTKVATISDTWGVTPSALTTYHVGDYASNITIDGCTVVNDDAFVTADRLHGYVQTSTATAGGQSEYYIRNCNFSGATELGIELEEASVVHIENNQIDGGTSQAAGGGVAGIRVYGTIGAATRVWIKDNHVFGWDQFGIRLEQANRSTVTGNDVGSIDVGGSQTDVHGISIDDNCLRTNVSGNFVYDIGENATGGGDTRVGIFVDGQKVKIIGNDVRCHSAVTAGAEDGIELGTSTTNCIADANQTNGDGLTDNGAANTTGASNRDDV